MNICHSISDIRQTLKVLQKKSVSTVLVPTMGNLHDGHLSLVRKAKSHGDKVIVSLFVNPKQFGPNEDFNTYPRTLEHDLNQLSEQKTDIVFIPEKSELYPDGDNNQLHFSMPPLSTQFCGRSRPQFFPGILLVVAKLFNIIQPTAALFGEKDFQQLTLIRQMVNHLNFPVEIIPAPTVREADGLAMSSRNNYLSKEERLLAPYLYTTLNDIKDQILNGNKNFNQLENKARDRLNTKGFETDYFAIRNMADLKELEETSQSFIILAAAKLGRTRLIDNVYRIHT